MIQFLHANNRDSDQTAEVLAYLSSLDEQVGMYVFSGCSFFSLYNSWIMVVRNL